MTRTERTRREFTAQHGLEASSNRGTYTGDRPPADMPGRGDKGSNGQGRHKLALWLMGERLTGQAKIRAMVKGGTDMDAGR